MLSITLRSKGKSSACDAFTKLFNVNRLFSTDKPTGRLEGKIAVITGAASGIGKATANEFIKNGAKVIIADIQDQLGESTAKDLGPNATFIQCDVTNESQVASAVELAMTRYGRLDIMYNNAGTAGTLTPKITDLDLDGFDRTMAINTRAMVAGMKHAARVMIPRKTGSIICTASIGGIMGGITPHDYAVSKAAILGLVKSVSHELRLHGIRVNCISPPVIPTPMVINAIKKMIDGIETEQCVEMAHNLGEFQGATCDEFDIANAALFLVSEESKYVSGHNLVVDGGFTAYKRVLLSGIA